MMKPIFKSFYLFCDSINAQIPKISQFTSPKKSACKHLFQKLFSAEILPHLPTANISLTLESSQNEAGLTNHRKTKQNQFCLLLAAAESLNND